MTVTDLSEQDRHQTTPASLLLRACALSMAIMAAGIADAASPSENGQVNIRMQFVEVDRHEILDLGIDWDKSANEDGIAFGLASAGAPADVGVDPLIEALEREGKVEILAEPNLTSIDGEPANFLIGGEVPVSVSDNGSDNVEYKPFGISVTFTPTLLSDDRIDVRVRPELITINPDDMAANDVRLSSFTTHEAEATFDLVRGQAVAIIGLFDRERSSDFADLLDLPVVSSLLSSERFRQKETDLIILVTARSVS